MHQIFATFLLEFNNRYQKFLIEGRTHLQIAFAKSKSITIRIPVELIDSDGRQLGAYFDEPENSGFATRFAISFAILINSGKPKNYQVVPDPAGQEEASKAEHEGRDEDEVVVDWGSS